MPQTSATVEQFAFADESSDGIMHSTRCRRARELAEWRSKFVNCPRGFTVGDARATLQPPAAGACWPLVARPQSRPLATSKPQSRVGARDAINQRIRAKAASGTAAAVAITPLKRGGTRALLQVRLLEAVAQADLEHADAEVEQHLKHPTIQSCDLARASCVDLENGSVEPNVQIGQPLLE